MGYALGVNTVGTVHSVRYCCPWLVEVAAVEVGKETAENNIESVTENKRHKT